MWSAYVIHLYSSFSWRRAKKCQWWEKKKEILMMNFCLRNSPNWSFSLPFTVTRMNSYSIKKKRKKGKKLKVLNLFFCVSYNITGKISNTYKCNDYFICGYIKIPNNKKFSGIASVRASMSKYYLEFWENNVSEHVRYYLAAWETTLNFIHDDLLRKGFKYALETCRWFRKKWVLLNPSGFAK